MSIDFIILGIGNVGSEYDKTRHNVGFDVVDAFVEGQDYEKKSYEHSEGFILTESDKKVLLIKPNTYVNRSGDAAREVLDRYEVSEEKLVVVVDDFHLGVETLRYRAKGSAGGHNGLKLLIEQCGSTFTRLRFGIGPLPEDESIIDFVLGRFSTDHQELVDKTFLKAKDSLSYYIEHGITATMNRYNG